MRAELHLDSEELVDVITRHVRERLGSMADEWEVHVPAYAVHNVTVTIKDKTELAIDARYQAQQAARKAAKDAEAASIERILSSPTDSELAAQVAAAADSSHSDPF